MHSAELTVHTLRLTQPAPRAWVEDALRVSSKPLVFAHRYVLVRSLRVSTAPGASTQSLALMLERAWLRIAAEAQPIVSAAASADAVWADDETAARVALIERWVRGADASAWFWVRVAGGPSAESWPARAAALMLAPLAQGSQGPMGAGRAGGPDAVLDRVRAGLAVVVAHAAVGRFVEAVGEAQATALAEVLETALPSRFAARALSSANSQAGPGPDAPALRQGEVRLRAALEATWPVAVHRQNAQPVVRPPLLERRGSPLALAVLPPVSAPEASHDVSGDNAAPPPRDAPAHAAASAAPMSGRPLASTALVETSAWSGLWLLLPILLRHGLADAAGPAAALAEAFAAACERYRVPPDDPVRVGITTLALPRDESTGLWLHTARRASAHDAGLPLRSVLHRRGRIWVSDVRIDIEYALAQADVRIRRAGFDLDPGYLPWLARSVHIHYC